MLFSRFFAFFCVIFTVFVASAAVQAQTTAPNRGGRLTALKEMIPFSASGKKVEADPNKEYTLNETNGPFMIFAYTFSGPKARQQANTLAFELRKDYQLPSYVYNRSFTHDTRQDRDIKQNPYARTRAQYKKKGKVEEYAVIVGDFQSADDENFQKTLKIVREAFPACMKTYLNILPSQQIPKGTPGPFVRSFGITNPILGASFFSPKGTVDEFVEKLNNQRPYSLLNNPGRYTVQVATFTGKAVIRAVGPNGLERSEVNKILGGPVEQREMTELEKGEKAAALLCRVLREQHGFEAYEFHDRDTSIVTVGSFAAYGRQTPNGMMDYDPQIKAILQQFQGQAIQDPSMPGGATYKPKVFGNVECDMQPRIIEVPRRRRPL